MKPKSKNILSCPTTTWHGKICVMCGKEIRITWRVTDKVWNRVVAISLLDEPMCLECFLRLAGNDMDKLQTKHFKELKIGGANFL
jgi:hypothetical protein